MIVHLICPSPWACTSGLPLSFETCRSWIFPKASWSWQKSHRGADSRERHVKQGTACAVSCPNVLISPQLSLVVCSGRKETTTFNERLCSLTVLILLSTEHDKSYTVNWETAESCQAPRARQKDLRTWDQRIPPGSPEAAQDHPTAGERKRPLHQWDQQPHA